ncbi:hypothetical protein M902_1799 [Bacteriovorax sp. BAL6_X]|uniref:DUF1232 domain-containing protein n=1 Tax=Bacteriovorax sp. BAL6_X TaxID=1201290 RepID=UPI0003863B21|nr:DUF1232 domain-containing protein [Bacteriovorax sp. BAL6_X]EPZ52062.1 hypothetical protein M902_1799 [Bacteriovorax sp. BAL6_X]
MKNIVRKVLAALGLVISVVYLLNPTAGVIELIPDNIPYIGNLDEAGAVMLFLSCLKILRQSYLRD